MGEKVKLYRDGKVVGETDMYLSVKSDNIYVDGVIIEIEDADKLKAESIYNVFKNLEHSTLPIGVCQVYMHDRMLYGNFVLYEDCNGLYPSIGYMKITNNDFRLLTIGLCYSPNLDKNIKPLDY